MAEEHAGLFAGAGALALAGQPIQAIAEYRRVLDLHPDAALGWAAYGKLLLAKGRVQAAQEACAKALQLDAGILEARLDLARCLLNLGEWPAAEGLLTPAVELASENTDVTALLMHLALLQGNQAGLRREMLRRVDADYSGTLLEWERSCVNLICGALAEGWEQFESRCDLPGRPSYRLACAQPCWAGEPLAGRTLLLHWEQGFGDTVMFVRYAALVKALGATVVLLVQPELADLVATCPGVDRVIAHGAELPAFDYYLPLLSLPRLFHTEVATIPAAIPYLDIPAHVPNRAGIAQLLALALGRTRIAVCWAGSPTHARDGQRSLPAKALGPLQALPDIAWYSFQPGARETPPFPGIIPLGPLLTNFSDTAYALSGMDLVITVDTALAHVAGALGIPTLLLISYIPDWRWMFGRTDSPWYPTLRLYRQPAPRTWGPVIQQLIVDLGGVPTP